MGGRLDIRSPQKAKLDPVKVALICDQYGAAAARERWPSWSYRRLKIAAAEGREIIQRRRAESAESRQPAGGRCGRDAAADLLLDADVGLAPAEVYNPLSSAGAFGAADIRHIDGGFRAPAPHAL
ncbi:hypothetical protein IP86_02765 [Rhodopseudomonas sp. AAP120]|uniref:hypothetical protein n=1 Tax=Rhodopseudomonas TaxID=1073 RepID=UPI0001779707|nr:MULTISPECIES: hypothetical protein [Rhodopseudomonas]ACF00821.1 hypothetical protein Rpal_2303 [Rhodopseudomonas palustris TIE-1]KPG01752.1 hypothetical protein IP86_02765 [Rhodopseudomonas sp. AAP120]